MNDVSSLVVRLRDSVGEAIIEDSVESVAIPEPRTSWVELQHEAVAAAGIGDESERRMLAEALLDAVLEQPSFGPSNRLSDAAFEFLLSELGDDLASALHRGRGTQHGGQRYVCQHIWSMSGEVGARWFGRLARADDGAANSLYQRGVPPWSEEDWLMRLDVLADLPARPRPSILGVLSIHTMPKFAAPGLVRVALAHGTDERDPLVHFVSERLRALRSSSLSHDVDMFCWDEMARKPDLARWVLELSGPPGDRSRIVEEAVRAQRISSSVGALLDESLERPAWADGEVPWTVESTAILGSIELPSRRLTGGDPWWTGGLEGLPWVVNVDRESIDVMVVVADHPLYGRQCAALVATVGPEPVENWFLVEGGADGLGYTVEVGVAGFGSVEFYDSGNVFDLVGDDMIDSPPIWNVASTPADGGIAMCSVGPQHQLCRTWSGLSAHGRVVQLVTDLGLLELDPTTGFELPW